MVSFLPHFDSGMVSTPSFCASDLLRGFLLVGFYVPHQVLVLFRTHPVSLHDWRERVREKHLQADDFGQQHRCRIAARYLPNFSEQHFADPFARRQPPIGSYALQLSELSCRKLGARCLRTRQRFRSRLSSVLYVWNSSNTPSFEKRYKALWKFQIAENKASAI